MATLILFDLRNNLTLKTSDYEALNILSDLILRYYNLTVADEKRSPTIFSTEMSLLLKQGLCSEGIILYNM